MDKNSPLLVISTDEASRGFYNQLAASMGYEFFNFFVGSPLEYSRVLQSTSYAPKFVLIDVGTRVQDVLPELDILSEYCEVGTRVVVVGKTNDISFYRELMDKGVSEYLTHPFDVDAIRKVFLKNQNINSLDSESGKVLLFMGGGAGDGSSTVAANVAYSLASRTKQPTVLVDMDYQFGMVAKNLDAASTYGICDVFDHPERGIDAMLLERMVFKYGNCLDIIAAPARLDFMPVVSADTIREFIRVLRTRYVYVILDIPHVWGHWTAAALTSSDRVVLVAQLWLKSVTHSSRLLSAWRGLGIPDNTISVVINRSGSKFKEAINPKDFERVCEHNINYYLSNDIKTAARAEAQGTNIVELSHTPLANQMTKLADDLAAKIYVGGKNLASSKNSSKMITYETNKKL